MCCVPPCSYLSLSLPPQEKKIATSQNQYKDLQATHEKANSEVAAKQEAAIKELRQHLQETEQRLTSAQKTIGGLEKQAADLKKEAEHAKVRSQTRALYRPAPFACSAIIAAQF